jgi:hypothetical protein
VCFLGGANYIYVCYLNGIVPGFSPGTSVSPCQYHSTNVPYSFIHLPPTLYNVFLPVLQFPLSTIPPMLHTHHLAAAVTRRTNGRSLAVLPKSSAVTESGRRWREKYFQSESSEGERRFLAVCR